MIKPYIIAEIGVNFVNNFNRAKKIIKLAKDGGADAVKFQSYKAETIACKKSPYYWDLKKVPIKSQYELFKKPESIAILLNTSPTILASLAPPLWMIQNRLWTLFSITMLFYFFLFMVSPWLFFIGWILKSWYVGTSQVDILRLFYRLGNYRLSSIFCAESEKEAQELSRKFDNKIDFYYS